MKDDDTLTEKCGFCESADHAAWALACGACLAGLPRPLRKRLDRSDDDLSNWYAKHGGGDVPLGPDQSRERIYRNLNSAQREACAILK